MGRRQIFERMMRAMDLNGEPIPGKPLIEIIGNTSLLIENHCGIVSYSKECVTIKTKGGCICVQGSGLVINKMSKEVLRICGRIQNVELRGRG